MCSLNFQMSICFLTISHQIQEWKERCDSRGESYTEYIIWSHFSVFTLIFKICWGVKVGVSITAKCDKMQCTQTRAGLFLTYNMYNVVCRVVMSAYYSTGNFVTLGFFCKVADHYWSLQDVFSFLGGACSSCVDDSLGPCILSNKAKIA